MMSITIIGIDDDLSLERIKQHLQVEEDFLDDDVLIAAYAQSSLVYAENYSGKSWATWNLSESFSDWLNPMFLDWNQEVRTASIEYDNTSAGVSNLEVTVYADNAIREEVPADYLGGAITISYSPYVDQHQKGIAEQARLLMIGDSYSHREDTITGTIVSKLPNGVKPLLDTIKKGNL